MTAPTITERLLIARQTAHASARAAAGRIALAPGLGWRLMRSRVDPLLFIPPDMRPADPSLVDEIAAGELGLGGAVLDLGGSSPFAMGATDQAWARELHGFVWLGSLRSSGEPLALEAARRLVGDWCQRNHGKPGGRGIAAEPEVIARRVTSFIVNAGFLLEDSDTDFYRLFARALGAEMRALHAASRRAAPGYPRLATAMALTLACVATHGREKDLASAEARLLAELKQQILGDGGHFTRNPETVLEILLDLLPIRQCYAACGLASPPPLEHSLERMLDHLHVMAMGPGMLARFNGVGSDRVEALATVLSLGIAAKGPSTRPPGPSGYARLERGGTTVVVDCGRPPPMLFSGHAHAGALSFELAHRGERLIVNGGAPGPRHREALADARATASHSTLSLDDQSSSRLVRSRQLERLIGGPALAGPDRVEAELTECDGSVRLRAWHDGYLSRLGMIHERHLTLSVDGKRLTGSDILRPPHGTLRLTRDVPLAVHFHLPVEATARAEADGTITIDPASGPRWRFAATGARCLIESGTDFAQSQGPSSARQIVMRASTPGETRLEWWLERD